MSKIRIMPSGKFRCDIHGTASQDSEGWDTYSDFLTTDLEILEIK